jgi:hypothetical protein
LPLIVATTVLDEPPKEPLDDAELSVDPGGWKAGTLDPKLRFNPP